MTGAALDLLGGLVGLVLAGGLIVSGASTIGLRLGLAPLVVGLTIVAAGTSAPELAVVWRAADQGDPGLALGSIVGSNIANVLLVVGLVAVIGAIPVTRRTVRVDMPMMVAASIATFALAADGTIGRSDGAVLMAGLIIYIGWTLWSARGTVSHLEATRDAAHDGAEITGQGTNDLATDPGGGAVASPRPTNRRTLVAFVAFAVGAVGVAFAAQFVVSGAEEIALSIGVPELVVGLTVLAVGTSMPEIVTSIIAAIRGNSDVAIGNAIGSNVFNLLFVLGLVSVTHSDLPVADELLRLDLPIMLCVAALCIPFALTGSAITRWEGVALVALYGGYTAYLVLDGLDNASATPVGVTTVAAIVPIAMVVVIGLRRDRRAARG